MQLQRVIHCLGLLFTVAFITLAVTGCAATVEPEYEAPGGFLLGPEDLLEITVWKNADLSRVTPIRPDGLRFYADHRRCAGIRPDGGRRGPSDCRTAQTVRGR